MHKKYNAMNSGVYNGYYYQWTAPTWPTNKVHVLQINYS